MMIMSRRRTLMLASAVLSGLSLSMAAPVWAQTKEVKIGIIVPLSGPWARSGEMMVKGANIAVEDINRAGGIKALGGARLRLVSIDAGDSTEKAKNAAQRMVSQETDMVGATGSWLSSFTLAVTEVTERAEMPFLTLSFSDAITDRGFKYVFQTSPTGGAQATGALPAIVELSKAATGAAPKTVGIIMDNTASPVSFSKPLREGGFEKLGIKMVMDEIYTPPLADATSIIQKVRSTRPDFLLLLATNVPDTKILIEKMNEFGMGRGRIPMIGSGASFGAPELTKVVGADLMEGVMSIVANWGAKGQEALIADFKKRANEPWMTQDAVSSYGDMWIYKEALEKAGAADRQKVAAAIRAMDSRDGAAKFFPGGRVKFEPNGRRTDAALVIMQWQKGEPVTVYPPASALAAPIWPKR
jgi:branched-chain amino acid transport system substrate-binding protein